MAEGQRNPLEIEVYLNDAEIHMQEVEFVYRVGHIAPHEQPIDDFVRVEMERQRCNMNWWTNLPRMFNLI